MSNQSKITPSDLLTNLFYVINPEKAKTSDLDLTGILPNRSSEIQSLDDVLEPDTVEATLATDLSSRSLDLIESIISRPELQKYALTADEVIIIAKCWGDYVSDGRSSFSAKHLTRSLHSDTFNLVQAVPHIIDLLDRKIFKFDSNQDADYHYNPTLILDESYGFDAWFFCALLGMDFFSLAKARLEAKLAAGDYSPGIYFDFLKLVFDSYSDLNGRSIKSTGYYYGRMLQPVFAYLGSTLDTLPADAPLNVLKGRFHLSVSETMMALAIYYLKCVRLDDIPGIKLLNLFANDEADYERLLTTMVNVPAHPIHSVLGNDDYPLGHRVPLHLKEAALALLERQSASTDKATSALQQQIADSEVLSLLKTSQTIESLILPPETKDIITSMVVKVQDPAAYGLAQWGLMSESLTDNEAVLNSVCMLLHGNPGTGKTFAAGAIANALGKELVNINASNMKTCYYGESQKIVRSTFEQMRKICAESSNPPVFLLNEADQLIHVRSDLSHSCSETENAIQNIILEELETFPGILIATTNLVSNLDVAFSRRFAYKLELALPDEDCRRQLWKLHLPATIPGSADIDIAYLAKKHSISGGQIKVIVQNACSAAIIRPAAERRLTMLDIVKYAELEDANCFEVKTKKIGFGQH